MKVIELFEGMPKKKKKSNALSLRRKAKNTGIPFVVLNRVFHRGMADWRKEKTTLTQRQYAMYRVNKFILNGRNHGRDKDLWKKVPE